MKPASARDYVALVRASKLLDDRTLYQTLDQLKSKLGPDSSNASLTMEMVAGYFLDEGLLTDWHHKQLLKGRHKGFFLGKYKLLRHLGSGGMSSVYLAEHRHMRRKAAVKILPQDRVGKRSYLERFLREAQAIAQLDHPNIVQAYEVDHVDQTYFLVMEFVEGQDLHRLVYKQGPLSEEIAADYMYQASDGLGHAHDRGLVHRDIKPANLLVDAKGTVKILDLGLALITLPGADELTLRHRENVIGTTDYMAPEQAVDSHHIDLRADIYGLGCTLYHLLSGNVPFPDTSVAEKLMKHQREEPKSLHKIRDDLSDDMVKICAKMMAKRPEDRYQTCHEVCEALQKLLRGSEIGSGTSSRFRVQEGSGSKHEFEQADTNVGLEDFKVRTTAKEKPQPRPRTNSAVWMLVGGVAVGALLLLVVGALAFPMIAATPSDKPEAKVPVEPIQQQILNPPSSSKSTKLPPRLPNQRFSTQDTNLPALIRLQWPESERDNATLQLNNKTVYPIGDQEVLLTVPPGTHRVRITRAGRDVFNREVQLQSREEQILRVDGNRPTVTTTTPDVTPKPVEPEPPQPSSTEGVVTIQLGGGENLLLFSDAKLWEEQLSETTKFELTKENLAQAKSKPVLSSDNVKLGDRLEFDAGVSGLATGFSLQSLVFSDWVFNESGQPHPSIGITDTKDDDWQMQIDGGTSALGVWLVGNRETTSESMKVYGPGGEFYHRISAELLTVADGNGKSFFGLIFQKPIFKIEYDENEGQDDLGIEAISFGKLK